MGRGLTKNLIKHAYKKITLLLFAFKDFPYMLMKIEYKV
jgi:hypothetical protein